ncbi:uncharacterized protein LOC114366438 [Ostrinia furnacalis]|uniref:uncharacterized protein LOC114366438 n=1 Tax=Ostrinia furnacalis TaxID=93504 RepID=UPI00103B1E4A|nr:uncharacterized protein LOC114366438 [Ostrinia furnacalis]
MSYSQQSVLPPKLQEAIDKIIQNEDFISYHIEVKRIEINNSFVGEYREINIRGESKNGNKKLQLFTKTKPEIFDEMSKAVKVVNASNVYKIEAFMYSEFHKTINEVQEEANIPFEERYVLAKSYVSSDENTIIMENLAAKGFTMYPHQRVITLKFAELAIQSLAKFHSFAFILQEKRPLFYENKVKNMKLPVFYGKDIFNEAVQKYSQITIDTLNPEQKKKLEEYLPTTYDKYKKYTQDPADVWTLVHGDYKASNVLAKFENGDVIEVIPIDYQLPYYGCSIVDLIYFLISSTDREFRKNYMEHLKNMYHESMKNFLKLFNMDIEKYYPKAEFERLFKERLDFGLMLVLWLLPGALGTRAKSRDTEVISDQSKLNDLIQKRLSDIVDDYIQWGYL